MILNQPLFLLLFVPIGVMIALARSPYTHTIQFPKAAWLSSIGSSRAGRWLRATRWMEWAILSLMVVALAQPQWVLSSRYQTKQGIDIVAVLDTSGSMNAEDFKPKNRMAVAKETLNRFIRKRPNDRIGLVVFGSDALTKVPLTYDHSILSHHIAQTNVGDAGDGTAIGLAVATAINRLMQSTASSKVIILMTDGVNNAGPIDPLSAADIANEQGMTLYAIGIGDKKGAPIPIHHPTYGKRYARYPNGQLVLTEFDDTILKAMVNRANGTYFNATNTDELRAIYDEINALEKTVIQTNQRHRVMDVFPYIIGLIFALLVIKEVVMLRKLMGVRT